jgi:hypothetical protein
MNALADACRFDYKSPVMSLLTVEVEIDHGRVKPVSSGHLPDIGRGFLTLVPTPLPCVMATGTDGLPVIQASGVITSEQVREIEGLLS